MTGEVQSGRIIWITGLSGSGKTTLANSIVLALREKGIAATLIDGDEVRLALRAILPSDGSEYSQEFRGKLARTYFDLAAMLASQGYVVVVATMSLFHAVQQRNRALAENYFEVYLETNERVHLVRGDKLREHGVSDPDIIVGIGIPPEFPESPDVHIRVDETWSKSKVFGMAMSPIWNWILDSTSRESGSVSR